jgi:hypothetical protein
MPQHSLEEFFLTVVRDAQRDRLVTAGAELGTQPASFLMGGREQGKQLVDDLIEAARREAEGGAEPAAQPAVMIRGGADEAVIGDLLARGAAAESKEEEAAQAETARESTVRREVLEDLMDKGTRGGKKADEGKA